MNITKKHILSMLTAGVLTLSGASQAALTDRGGGLIYDDVLDVTWLQDANYAKTSGYAAANLKNDGGYDDILADGRMGWDAAKTWVANLSYDGGSYGTIDDWRLADMKPVNYTAFQDSTDKGFNINSTQSELGYMFYQNLANTGFRDIAGILTGCSGADFCLTNTGLFENLESGPYWSAVEYTPDIDTDYAWLFNTGNGYQGNAGKYNELYAWAVRSGDVTTSVVPVPTAFWLMLSGLLGMVSLRKKTVT